jgi:hypothetical protein
MTYQVPEQVLQGIIDYLATRPYKEVAGGLQELAAIMQKQKEVPEKQEKTSA